MPGLVEIFKRDYESHKLFLEEIKIFYEHGLLDKKEYEEIINKQKIK